ncbi:hypothetical protein ONZ43_g989 [Nemania bipapillata]|uniref:Uncharacterized protein n=1 Tax=Nemania bipapillata TaxID=110536 RepID=A0ACC2J6D1_9PEZI|nr:hypothetical protein ONZ43_g989 [Nemania bipapillata]
MSLANQDFDFSAPLFTEDIIQDMIPYQEAVPAFRAAGCELQHTDNNNSDLYGSPSGAPSQTTERCNSAALHDGSEECSGARRSSAGLTRVSLHNRPDDRLEFSHMPALREVRARNNIASSPSTTKQPPPANCAHDWEKLDEFFEAVARFVVAISRAQMEIGGISSVVAEYLSWMREEPITEPSGTLKSTCKMMLQTLETRVKEVNHMAENSHVDAWEQLVRCMSQCEGLADKMNRIVEEIRKHSEETSSLFKEDYNICVSLSEQSHRQ